MFEIMRDPFTGEEQVVIAGNDDFDQFSNMINNGITGAVQQQDQNKLLGLLATMARVQPKPTAPPAVVKNVMAVRNIAGQLQSTIAQQRAILATRPNAIVYVDSGDVAANTNADITVQMSIANGMYRYIGLIADPETIVNFGGRTLNIGGQQVAQLGTSAGNDAGTLAVFAHDAFPEGRLVPWTGSVYVQNQPVVIGVRNITAAAARARFAVLLRVQPQGAQPCSPEVNGIMRLQYPGALASL